MSSRAVLATAVLLLCLGGCSGEEPARPEAQHERRSGAGDREQQPEQGEQWMRGAAVPPELARRPRLLAEETPPGLMAVPDGELAEWQGQARWDRKAKPLGAKYGGPADLEARVALASYSSGLSVAVEVRDDRHQPAQVAGALDRSDHVELELWPERRDAPLGLRFHLGTARQLVQVLRPAEPWREQAISAFGAATPEGYRIEARVPLTALTPLPSPEVKRVHYRVTVHDADEAEEKAEPMLELTGTVDLTPAMTVPAAVRERPSVRVCFAAHRDALWAYENGWRCAVPYPWPHLVVDDRQNPPRIELAFPRVPDPPRIAWIRERVLFLNFIGLERGVAALLDGRETILSVMPLGVVGAEEPGNPRARDSDAEVLTLPDGTYALAVTHAQPAQAGPLGGRCAGGHRILLSILALKGALKSTPESPAPDPPPATPFLEEVFRTVLEDCETSVANDWTLSRDARTIKVHSSLTPSRPAVRWVYRDGRYRRAAGPAPRRR